jgi:O-succinylbenzoic acid--CoA ligase
VVHWDGSPEALAVLTGALSDALSGGAAVLPVEAGRPVAPLPDGPDPAGVALVVETSGSTGEAKRVLLGAAALRASAEATHARLGGPGRWLLALPAHHIAGAQVIVRGLLAGHRPATWDLRGGFRPADFAAAAATLRDGAPAGRRHYTSLVPTQLHRVLAEGGMALDALRAFDAVLVGGAATPPELLARAREAEVAVVTTYGMSETSGGCVYDGAPLDGVEVKLAAPDGRIQLAGPMLAEGYLGAAELTGEVFAEGWFRTSDLGAWDGDRLRVVGRADDVIITGGEKVHPAAVERVLTSQPGVRAACVVGVDDPAWGQRVVAAVVPAGAGRVDGGRLVKAVRTELGRPAAPKQVRLVEQLPQRGIGKPDRAAVAKLLAERAAHATVTTVATLGEWVAGARPRTLLTALAPVLVGTGAAIGSGVFEPVRAGLALLVAVALVIGVNYANDYSDGLRGTDTHRVGPLRLVGSGAATPAAVRGMALAWLGLALLAGATLVVLSRQWWLFGLGVACVGGAWCYTGGRRPYGYRGLGEIAVFLFFGPVAVLGTVYVQGGPPTWPAGLGAVGTGLLAAAVLVTNNLRDRGTDGDTGKHTLAVRMGERGTRRLYAALLVAPALLSALLGAVHPAMLLGLLAVPAAVTPVRRVLGGATGRDLAPVAERTAIVLLVWAAATGAGIALTAVLPS